MQTPAMQTSPPAGPQKVTGHSSGCHGLDGGEVRWAQSNGYMLTIRPAPSEMEALCFIDVVNGAGHKLFELNDFAIGLHDATGKDIDGDGKGDAVIEATTGGHCCFQYAILSLTPPKILARIRNEREIAFEPGERGIVLHTQDGVFDFFGGFFATSPRADVFLRFEQGELRDVSTEHIDEYDRQIAEARQKLSQEEIERFHESGPAPDKPEIHAAVVTIVLEYLYSGRADQAWKEFDAMWPEKSRERFRKLIIDTRARGILAPISGGKK